MSVTPRHSLVRAASATLLAAVALSAGCKDDATSPAKVVTQNAVIPANGTVVAAIANTTFNFPGAAAVIAPALTGQNLALTFAGTSAAPTASMTFTNASGAQTGRINTTVRFGSCIFTVTEVVGNITSPRVGDVITVNPCSLNLQTAGTTANGQPTPTPARVTLGTAQSQPSTVQAATTSTGTVQVGGQNVGTVPVTNATG